MNIRPMDRHTIVSMILPAILRLFPLPSGLLLEPPVDKQVKAKVLCIQLFMTSTRLPKTITAGALLATPIPPVKWIIPGLLPAGLAIFAGPSKAGKSWLTLWLCLQISQGKSVWGREIEPRTVLYFSLEDTLGRLQERLYQLVDAEEDPERLILQTESHGIGQGLEEQIVSFIHTYPDISLIVIDTLQKVRKSDQNGSMYANKLDEIAENCQPSAGVKITACADEMRDLLIGGN